MKKLLSIMLTVMLVTALLPVLPVAADASLTAVGFDTADPVQNLDFNTVNAMVGIGDTNSFNTFNGYNSGFTIVDYQNWQELGTGQEYDSDGNASLKMNLTWGDGSSDVVEIRQDVPQGYSFAGASTLYKLDMLAHSGEWNNERWIFATGPMSVNYGTGNGDNRFNQVDKSNVMFAIWGNPSNLTLWKGTGTSIEGAMSYSGRNTGWKTYWIKVDVNAANTQTTYTLAVGDKGAAAEDCTVVASHTLNAAFQGLTILGGAHGGGNDDPYSALYIDNLTMYGEVADPSRTPVPVMVPDSSATYTVDTTATAAQAANDYNYGWDYSNGISFSAESGDIDRRTWVNGCNIGNQVVTPAGLTIAFDMILPATNAGRIYYSYSGSQNNEGKNPFFGFKYVAAEGGYRLLKNLANTDETDRYYNNKVYTGTVPVILYLWSDTFELYVDNAYVATVDTNTALGTRWYYAFVSHYASGSQTSFGIDNLCYLRGRAINQIAASTEVPSEAPSAAPTEAVTEAPTTAASAAPGEATLIRTFNLNEGYYNNSNGGTYGYKDGVLTMAANVALPEGNRTFSRIYWMNDSEKAANKLTWAFDAKIFGWEDYANEHDGFAFRLRYTDANNPNSGIDMANLFRVFPLESDVRVRVEGGAEETISGGFHAYSVVCDMTNKTFTLYIDGAPHFTNVAFTIPEGKALSGFIFINAMERATNCKLRLADMQTYRGAYVRASAGSYTEPVAPVITVSNAKSAYNGEIGAFYYVISLTLNDGTADTLTVSYNPEGLEETEAVAQNFDIAGISGVTAKFVSVLKGIPEDKKDRTVNTKVTVNYSYDCNAFTSVTEKAASAENAE